MRIKILNDSAFSLLEILLASVIFVISVAGVFVTITSVRAPVTSKENQLAAAILGKQVLEALSSQVSYSGAAGSYDGRCPSPLPGNVCGDFSLYLGPHQVTLPAAGITWPAVLAPPCNPNLSYTVSCADGLGFNNAPFPNALTCNGGANIARQVTLNIKWPDSSGVC